MFGFMYFFAYSMKLLQHYFQTDLSLHISQCCTSVLNVNNVRVASTQAHFLAPDDSFVLHELQAMAYQNDKFVKAEKCFTQADENGTLNPLATRGNSFSVLCT